MYKNFDELFNNKEFFKKTKSMLLIGACDKTSLEAVADATSRGIIEPILVGKKEKIEELLKDNDISIDTYEIIDAKTSNEMCEKSINYIIENNCDFLMKGTVNTSEIIKSILVRKKELLTNKLISHISLLEIPYLNKIISLSDTSINIKPNLEEKAEIIKNSRDFLIKIGYIKPKVAILSSIETVNEKMQDTVDAHELKLLNQKNVLDNCIIEGPISFDLAIDEKAAKNKKYKGRIKGDADLLIAPDIVSGNLLGKCFNYVPNSKFAGVILGVKFPIVLTSRASSKENKYYSILVGGMSTKEE